MILCLQIVCWAATLIMVCYWIYAFCLNENLCTIDYKTYLEGEADEFPTLSMCFPTPISEEKMMRYNPGIDVDTYLSFLSGRHFNVSLFDIDYKNTSLDMSDYVRPEYWIIWSNKSTSYIINNTDIFKRTHGIFSFDAVPVFYQCYELQLPKIKGFEGIIFYLRSNLIVDRSQEMYSQMLTFLHYPNHLLSSFKNIKLEWEVRNATDKYMMSYYVNGVEVIEKRNKRNSPCYEWKNYDISILENHAKKVGCKAPYQSDLDFSQHCYTKELMKKAAWTVGNGDFGIPPTCKSMDKIYYKFQESDISQKWTARENFVSIGYFIIEQQFKEIVQTRYLN